MAGDFLDTSALAKHYHPELGSAEIDHLWGDAARQLFVSRLSVLEMVSVFAGKLRSGAITLNDFDALRRRFAADLTKNRRLTGVRVLVRHYQHAERLLRLHGAIRRLRTLDSLQLAVASELHRRSEIARVVSADKDLLAVAAAEGIATFNPESP